MSLTAIIGGILLALFQIWGEYMKGAPARKAKANAITRRDIDELERGMARVDADSWLP